MNVCLLPLCMINNYVSVHVLLQCILFQHFIYFHVHGEVARMVNSMVASSSPVGGLGTLQCGIRAHVAAWASMAHEEAVIEARLPLPSRGKMRNTGRISKKFF